MPHRLVSIVTPLYNGADFIGETIDSVIAQTYAEWELLIIDDYSSDGGRGRAVVEQYVNREPRIRLIVLDVNLGSSGARNVGIREAQGDIVAFLDADDLWDKKFLEKQLAFMQQKKAIIAFSSYRRIDEQTGQEALPPFIVPETATYRTILKSLPIFPSTALLDISRIGKFYFDEKMGSMRDDYTFWLYLLKHQVACACGNQEVLASYRLRRNSITSNKWRVIIPHWQVLRKKERLPWLSSIYYLCCWIIISIKKYRK